MKAKILSALFSIYNLGLKIKNIKKTKLLIYTDSRGYNVVGSWGKNPFDSYVKELAKKYRVSYFICPEKYTTIVDFLDCYERLKKKKFDLIILHCGVVDFSPRPLSNILSVKESKKGKIAFTNLFDYNKDYYNNPYETLYKNEFTTTLYSETYLQVHLADRIKKIDNLIWINSNHFVNGWEGNFTKGRPSNIENMVNKFDILFERIASNSISLKDWDDRQIMQYTIDNIHFTRDGFLEIIRRANNKINEITTTQNKKNTK